MGGKFLLHGEEKLYIRGVTYGAFRLDEEGFEYPAPAVVARDFAQIAAHGMNAVRTYTVPPLWLLDLAERHGLLVMVGLPWEQHVAFLEDDRRAESIERRVREGVRACAAHPAVLCYLVGNEIPASIVRWHGRRRVERFLERLYHAAKAEDPEGLVAYVNYPSTEYLQLSFVDLLCFNVYLERQPDLERYLARLQNVAEELPLILGEIGLDSRRNGEAAQAESLAWQVRTAFAGGCAGAFVFAWTDEWHRGGHDIEDWDFGLTDRERNPKPALAAVREAYVEAPFPPGLAWPSVSVIVCTHNGERTLGECLEGLGAVRYPGFEVIVVDDASTDRSAAIAAEHGVQVIEAQGRGLSAARNTGLAAARGEIVAYVDDDAVPDPDWLSYLARAFMTSSHAGVGGPNFAFTGDGAVADCVGNAPGGPTHVLLSDREAEHIPGCNMAFRRACLEAVGGFDASFQAAGDDVDICWRLQDRGWTLGYSPAAFVWHHRRDSVLGYWRQQRSYGKAEALLERKWPEKYSAGGHVTWRGRLYGEGFASRPARRRWHIYYGVWGTGPFQSIYQPAGRMSDLMPLLPEIYLLVLLLGGLSAVGLVWSPLLLALPLLGVALTVILFQAAVSAVRPRFDNSARGRPTRLALRGLTAFLYLLQPVARLLGRLGSGLTPWRRRGPGAFVLPRPRTRTVWREHWSGTEERLSGLEGALRRDGATVLRGGDYDRWDLEVRGGPLGAARARMAVEEHGGGKQLLLFRIWPRISPLALVLALLFATLAVAAAIDGALPGMVILGLGAGALLGRELQECGAGTAAFVRSIDPLDQAGAGHEEAAKRS